VPVSDARPDQNPVGTGTHWESNVLTLVHRLSSGIGRVFNRRLRIEHGVTVPEWRTMLLLAERPGATAVDIATVYAMDKMAITRAVQRLMRDGLIERHQRSDDKRSFSLLLTPRGNELYAALLPTSSGRYRELVDVLTRDERRQLRALLVRLIERTDELDR
jgi:DNA-binding MarR family transcriptional regulator